jgi:hypothetical protein
MKAQKVSGRSVPLYIKLTPWLLHLWERIPRKHRIGGWVGSDGLEKRKIPCAVRIQTPYLQTRNLPHTVQVSYLASTAIRLYVFLVWDSLPLLMQVVLRMSTDDVQQRRCAVLTWQEAIIRQEMYVQRDIVARSRNHCCNVKAINIT